jgi:hypothetical protein
MAMTYLSDLVRHEGDPHVIETGQSSLSAVDQLARMLGWFSLGLGAVELLAPGRVTRALGMEGSEKLVRAFGAREIGAGILTLSLEKELGLWSRVAGDGVDLAALFPAMREDNPKRDNATLAMALVAGITLLDFLTARSVREQHKEGDGMRRDYRDRSGYPQGIEAARGIAKSQPQPERHDQVRY